MNKNFQIVLHGRVAVYNGIERLICDNTDYKAVFDLADSDFTTGQKYMVLITDKGKYTPIPFTGTECSFPAFTSADGASVKVGIYEGDLATTTAAEILIWPSILSIDAGDAEAAESGTYPVIDDAKDIGDTDHMIILPDGGQKSYVPISVLKDVFGEGGGSTGGDSYWVLDDDDMLTPSDDVGSVDLNNLVLSGVGDIMMSNGGVVMVKKLVFADPTTSTAGTKGEIIWSQFSDKFFVCTDTAGGVYTWDELVYRTFMNTQLNRYQLKLTAGAGVKIGTVDETDNTIYVDADSSVTQDGTKPVTGAAVDSYVTGKGYYTKPSGGIPKTDLASAVQTSLGAADTAYQKPQNGIPASDLASGVIPDTSNLIPAPVNPSTGDFLVWNGTAWAATTLSVLAGGDY